MKIIIAGSRGVTEYIKIVDAVVKALMTWNDPTITEIVSGGAKGVDTLGERYALEQDITIKRFIPDWDLFGKRAGFLRNQDMGDYADALIAVWDGESKGTLHMINYMKKLGKPVFVYRVDPVKYPLPDPKLPKGI